MNKSILKDKLFELLSNIIEDMITTSGMNIKDIKKFFNKDKGVLFIYKKINNYGINFFDSKLEYENFCKEILKEILEDYMAALKDKTIDLQIQKFENYNKTNESFIELPTISLTDLTNNIDFGNVIHKKILANAFKIYPEYIDFYQKKLHHFKINDMSGKLLSNNQVVFDAIIFNEDELKQIKNNLIDIFKKRFYDNLPSEFSLIGINLTIESWLKKDELDFTIENTIDLNKVIDVISSASKMNYYKNIENFYIWSNKK